jgi:hypothetical protein
MFNIVHIIENFKLLEPLKYLFNVIQKASVSNRSSIIYSENNIKGNDA